MARIRIAIACQGGGSQTAFTAGALSHLLRAGVREEFEIVSLSGASGGALCAALVWSALLLDEPQPWARLEAFWADNTAQWPAERAQNSALLSAMRWAARGNLPTASSTPYSASFRAARAMAAIGVRPEFADFATLLRKHFDAKALASIPPAASPVLLIGAVDVLSGRMREFTSREGAIRIEHLLASAAVPEIFEAVDCGDGGMYWDGLYSDNPPVGELVREEVVGRDSIPDEIWVIKINPTRVDRVPTAPDEIIDRRNELYGNISLFHQLASIGRMNDLFMENAFTPEFLERSPVKGVVRIPRAFEHKTVRPYHMPLIEMSAGLQQRLDYESKLDRSEAQMRELMADGAAQAAAFLHARVPMEAPATGLPVPGAGGRAAMAAADPAEALPQGQAGP